MSNQTLETALREAATNHSLFIPSGAFWGCEDIKKMADRGTLQVSLYCYCFECHECLVCTIRLLNFFFNSWEFLMVISRWAWETPASWKIFDNLFIAVLLNCKVLVFFYFQFSWLKYVRFISAAKFPFGTNFQRHAAWCHVCCAAVIHIFFLKIG